MNILRALSSTLAMSQPWSITTCARAYANLTHRDAAEDGRFPFLEGVFIWRAGRTRYDLTSALRRALKTTRQLRGRDDEKEAGWYARFKHAEPAFAAHAELHDGYENVLRIARHTESTTLQLTTAEYRNMLADFERAQKVPNAAKSPVAFFVLSALARWAMKGWGAPTPRELSLLAGATGFEPFVNSTTTRERWKARIRNWRRASTPDAVGLRAAYDLELDGSGCFVLAPLPKVSVIPRPCVELPLDETG